DHLDVDVGVLGAEHLGTHLVVLAVPAGLGLLVAECRRHVPDAPRDRRAVLDVRTDDGRGALGPQGEPSAAAVLELVHLLRDHLGGVPDAAAEHSGVFERRRVSETEAVARGELGKRGDERLPACGLGRQDVVGPLRAARRLAAGVVTGLVAHFPRPGSWRNASQTPSPWFSW